jgi:SPP1 gp7 family putative phage head morphogenesis protein
VEEAYLDFANGIEGVKRAGREFLNEMVKLKINERIVVGAIKGEGVHKIKREVKKLVEKRGFTALIDRGGKRWKIDTYAQMLVRTHMNKSNNRGTINRLIENGVDLIEMSSHENPSDMCAPLQGKIYSISGDNKKYPKAPDLPIHPNCRHSFLPYIEQ